MARARLALLGCGMLIACSGETSEPPTPAAATTPTPAANTPSSTNTTTAASSILPAGDPTDFTDQTNVKNTVHDFGYSDDVNIMVRQFAGGAASGDLDNDGDLDILVLRGNLEPNILYRNETGSTFTDIAAASGIANSLGPNTNGRHSGATFADLDGDGDLDVLLGGLEGDPTKIYLNDGFGAFTDATAGSGLDLLSSDYTVSMALGDYDGDGDLDIAMAHWGTPRNPAVPGETETLWRNDSDSTSGLQFTAVSQSSGIADLLALDLPQGVLGPEYDYSFAPSFTDIDDDGDQDLLIVSDFRGSRILLNQGDGTFVLSTFTPDDENGMGSAVGDYDNDGDMDWFISSINGNRLFENLGGGNFRRASESGVEPGGWGWGSCFADFNADGWLDIYQTNGWEAGKDPSASSYVNDTSRLWMNNGDGTFTDQAATSTMVDTDQGRGIICDDFDNDGDVDVLLLTAESENAAIFWENQLTGDNYVQVRLRGIAPNTFAIGARVELTIADTVQTRQVAINSNFTSHNSTVQTFGMGDQTSAGLRVVWPDGAETIRASISANQRLVIDHPSR
ncbi:MAG: CRTAC1 family protein [Pseudomonadota bacterium]